MTFIGEIIYVREGKISPDLDGCPVIVFGIVEGSVLPSKPTWKIRYQRSGQLSHDWWAVEEKDLSKYFERR